MVWGYIKGTLSIRNSDLSEKISPVFTTASFTEKCALRKAIQCPGKKLRVVSVGILAPWMTMDDFWYLTFQDLCLLSLTLGTVVSWNLCRDQGLALKYRATLDFL